MRDGWSIDSGPQAQGWVLRNPWEWASAALLFVLLAFSSYLKGDVSQVANPAVYDFLMVAVMGVHVMLRLRFPKDLGWPVLLWGLIFFGYAIGALDALFPHRSRDFMLVMVYLVASFAFFAAVIYDDPKRRLPAIWWGYVAAAFIASAIGLAAYFGVMPNAARYLKFGRVTSLFNDPNVFGAFLVAPILFLAMRLSLARRLREMLLVPVLGVLVLAIFLCFSRGAWANLVLSGAIFMALAFITSRSAVQRFRIVLVMLFAAAGGVLIVGWALSSDAVSDLFAQRFSLSQSYDVGADGRFDRQLDALAHGLRDPLGMGPAQWAQETGLAPHNVYLNVLLAGGYLSLLAYLIFIGLTLARGTAAVFRDAGSAYQPYLIVTVAAVTGQAAESIIIDVDNWRHLYLLFGLAWGGIALEARERRQKYAEWEQQSGPRPGPAEGFYA